MQIAVCVIGSSCDQVSKKRRSSKIIFKPTKLWVSTDEKTELNAKVRLIKLMFMKGLFSISAFS